MGYGPRFEEALVFAARLHREQVRKGSGVPYINHLLAVASLVGENGGSQEEVISALLHDAIEDQGGSHARESIRERFGDGVVAIVDECTDADVVPKPPWRARKEAHVTRLQQASVSALRVIAADKLHNARSLVADLREHGEGVWSRFNGGKDGTLWYYRAVVDILQKRLGGALVWELNQVVEVLSRTSGAAEGVKHGGLGEP
jgi:(p)ppGpp synthase/HD superfamily hydrolase